MTALIPWFLVIVALIVIGARTRDTWVIVLAIATFIAVCVLHGLLPALR
jgi:hypothetical protein